MRGFVPVLSRRVHIEAGTQSSSLPFTRSWYEEEVAADPGGSWQRSIFEAAVAT